MTLSVFISRFKAIFGVCGTSAEATISCPDGLGLSYTLPMFRLCPEARDSAGNTVQTLPKLIPASPLQASSCGSQRQSRLGIPPGRRVCRFPGESFDLLSVMSQRPIEDFLSFFFFFGGGRKRLCVRTHPTSAMNYGYNKLLLHGIIIIAYTNIV